MGDGLQTGISTFADDLWKQAGVAPRDIDVASIYDDYPAMVLAQLDDLGMIAGHDLARYCRHDIGEKRVPINTWGGMNCRPAAGRTRGRPQRNFGSRAAAPASRRRPPGQEPRGSRSRPATA